MKQELISSIRFRVKSLPLGSNESESIRGAILEDLSDLEKEIIHPCPEGEGVPIDIEAELFQGNKAEVEAPVETITANSTESVIVAAPEELPESTGSPEGERRPKKNRK